MAIARTHGSCERSGADRRGQTASPIAVRASSEWLQSRYPAQTPTTHPASLAAIAGMAFDGDMCGLCIGNVSEPGSSGKPVVVEIAITREGRLVITIPVAGGPQVWRLVN